MKVSVTLKRMRFIQTAVAFVVLVLAKAALAKCPPTQLSDLHASDSPKAVCYALSFYSESLHQYRDLNVFLPAHYRTRSARWPYAIFLHGRGGDRNQFEDVGGLQALDSLSQKENSGFLVFAPSGDNHYWMNAAISKERWGDLITRDLVLWIEANFRVDPNHAEARALFGISMGAAGTVQLGFNDPGIFAIAAALSPVFRRESEIGRPNTGSREPVEDNDSFGTGARFSARSPRELCKKNRRADQTCLPFASFRLDAGERDSYLARYTDTPELIQEWKVAHRHFPIAIGKCDAPGLQKCKTPEECYGHTYTYWRCELPIQMNWINEQFRVHLRREPAAKAKS